MSGATVLVAGKTKLTLGQNEYKAQGGEGTVYVKNGLAYKIYHDPVKMIPEGKILELNKIKTNHVLAPKDILYDPNSKKAVGFTMPYVSNTEYLTKLFSRKFKGDSGITPQMVIELVTQMQHQLNALHHEGIVVGDYNEMNFLVDDKYKIPYHIDVDSYQTANFPCTAIMDSVRDRQLPFGKFNEMSDWFSWAIVTFQMYTGVHPYKGRHPNFKTTELDERMKQNVSVFDPDVKIPTNCQDFSGIPTNLLEWYKRVFIHGERSLPPIAGAIGFVQGFQPIAVVGTGTFAVAVVFEYDAKILDVTHFDGYPYVITETGIYKKKNQIFTFNKTPKDIKLVNVLGKEPIIAMKENGSVGFFDFARNQIGSIAADNMMACNGSLYTITNNGQLIENYFETIGKVKHLSKVVDQITDVYKMFDGVVVQDVFGKRRLSIPYEHQKCASINVPELERYRIIDAKCLKNVCIIIGEKNGKYDRFVLFFNKDFTSYEVRVTQDIGYQTVNFMVKQNGMVASVINGDTLELFMDIKRGSKEIPDCPVELDMPLYDGIDKVLFVNGTKLYSITMSN